QLNQEPAVADLVSEYAGYNGVAEKLFAGQNVTYAALRKAAERVEKAIEQLRTEQQRSLERKLKESDDQESRTVVISIGLAIGGVATAFLIAFLMIYSFATSIGKLQRATHRISAGDFTHDPGI